MDLRERSVAIIGLGASGAAAARLAILEGGDVHVSDLRTDATTAARAAELRALGADVELGAHPVERVAASDLVVVSPGIPPTAPVLRALAERRVEWIAEPELAFRFFDGPLIAITGTNGKTTTAVLVAGLLEAAGLRAALGGNVGGGIAPAASELALGERPDWYVLEMSSFQLAGVRTFRPDVGVVTNLSPDHLDRYPDVAAYYADKARLFDNAGAESRWVLPAHDPAVEGIAGDAPGERFHFGTVAGPGVDAYLDEGALAFASEGAPVRLASRDELPLLGEHNALNALAAALVARVAGADPSAIRSGLLDARPLPHRLEPVADASGVLWVNDSKATNVAATLRALVSFDRPLILLLGGKDKGEDFSVLGPEVARAARAVVAFGAAGERIAAALEGATTVHRVAGSFGDAVAEARRAATDGDVVLLSPACSSFDMFESYEHRGRAFTELARASA